MYDVDVSDSDVVWADHTTLWMRDMATGRTTLVAANQFGAYPQLTHDRLMWQTMVDYYAASHRTVKLRNEGVVQSYPGRPTCMLDDDRITYVENTEQAYGVVENIDGTPIAEFGYRTFQSALDYPLVIWSAFNEVHVRDLSGAFPEMRLWTASGTEVAIVGNTAAWCTLSSVGDNRRVLMQTVPEGSLTVVRETRGTASGIDMCGDWITWEEGAEGAKTYVYAYHIPSGQTIKVTPSSDYYGPVKVSSTWLVWVKALGYGYGGQVYGCRLTDLLAALPAPVALRPTTSSLPASGISLTFEDTVSPGESSAITGPNRPAPAGYHLLPGTNWDIATQARNSGYTDITVPYDPATLGGAAESQTSLFLWKDGAWVNITSSVDTAANTVTGRTYYLSQVAVGRPRLPQETASVYRFYNKRSGTHFYTASAEERDMVTARWSSVFDFEGAAYTYDSTKATQPLYRFYNKKNGSHFYTASPAEADHVIATWPQVFDFEGPAYNISAVPTPGAVVYRFYNNNNGSHFFTASAEERDVVIQRWPKVYSYEGEAFYLPQ